MKQRLIFILMALLLASAPSWAQSKATTKASGAAVAQARPHRIVYDMTVADTARQAMLMRQLNNIKRGWPEAEVEVVVHGKALFMLVSDKTHNAEEIKALQAKGVVFAACENSMRALDVKKEQLLSGVNTVPMGVGEIIMKQEEGWGYIKF
ncbi:DsrE family protein [Pontibacter mangrovi]|uniref:Uncharacterized protein n=1 Tax=Pontibacter mangrovi TaxID=2589816 RepID=A0A501WBQ6_9BACT|nr:DsrE family protein [Pontibacter mangrovi]TPE46242.1 hypothetical protein FJM65_02550 [Pontibacter mangrovi]